MKKILKIILLFISCFFIFGTSISYSAENLDIGTAPTSNGKTDKLDTLEDTARFIGAASTDKGAKPAKYFLFRIARDLKNITVIVATLFLMYSVFSLIFAENSEEEFKKTKGYIIWTFLGIIFMQVSLSIITTLYDQDINGLRATSLITSILNPLLDFLIMGASFAFLGIAIYSFYLLVTANGEEEKIKSGRMSIAYGIGGFIIVSISSKIVEYIYGYKNGRISNIKLSKGGEIILEIIKWFNGFIAIAVVLLFIYAGAILFFSAGEEDKTKKAKNIIIYAIIGLFVLIASYLILNFFPGANI